jgi:hypothetical protein
LEEIIFENFNISENNIISVEPAKVLRYTLNFHPQKVGFRVNLSLPWPHAIHPMGVGSPFSFLESVQMGNPNAQGISLLICTKCSHGHSYFPSYEILNYEHETHVVIACNHVHNGFHIVTLVTNKMGKEDSCAILSSKR